MGEWSDGCVSDGYNDGFSLRVSAGGVLKLCVRFPVSVAGGVHYTGELHPHLPSFFRR